MRHQTETTAGPDRYVVVTGPEVEGAPAWQVEGIRGWTHIAGLAVPVMLPMPICRGLTRDAAYESLASIHLSDYPMACLDTHACICA